MFWGCIAALTVVRLVLTAGLFIRFVPDSGYDDMLQILKAMSIADGHWLGEYGPLTLVKGVGYPLLTALFSKLGIPYLLAYHGLYAVACLLFMQAVKPLARHRWQQLVCYGITLFNPIAFSSDINRLYRDIGYYTFAFFCIAASLGLLLRAMEAKPAWGYAAASGVSLAAAILFREDSQWLVVYMAACLLAWCVFRLLAGHKGWVQLACVPLAALLGLSTVLLPVCAVNYTQYGTFVLDEYNSGPYAAAYGALSRFDGGRQEPYITIAGDMREYVYERSPAFAELQEVLDGDGALWSGWKELQGEYRTGYFSFVLRMAAADIGKYADSETANAYFSRLAAEVNEIADSSEIETGPRRSGISARFYSWMLVPTLEATFAGLWATLRCTGISALPEPVAADDAYLRHFESFVHGRAAAYRYMEESEETVEDYHLAGLPLWMQRACRVLVAVWSVLLAPLFLLAVVAALLLTVWLLRKKGHSKRLWLHVIGLMSLLCALLLRCAMIAFVHVSTFPAIYTPAYQAATYPVITGFIAMAFLFVCHWLPIIQRKGNEIE